MSRNFDGVDDKVEIGDNISLDVSQSNSFMCWIYIDSFGVSGTQFIRNIYGDEDNASLTALWRLGSRGDSALAKRIGINFKDAGGNHDEENNTDLSLNIWTHIAVTTDGTNARWYINGFLDTTKSYSITPVNISDVWNIGRADGVATRPFDGKIAFLSFHNGVTLSEGEINQNMIFPGSVVRGLKLFAPLWGGSPEPDYSGNGNHGTVTGATIGDTDPNVGNIYFPRKRRIISFAETVVAPTDQVFTPSRRITRSLLGVGL